MQKVEWLAIALCICVLAGLAMYALDILNVPGADHLIQQANAIRRSSHQCTVGIILFHPLIDLRTTLPEHNQHY
jgi:hypothetical protein